MADRMTYSDIALGVLALVAVATAATLGRDRRRGSKRQEHSLGERVRGFFNPTDVRSLTTVSRKFSSRLRADLQKALDSQIRTMGVKYTSGMRAQHSLTGIDFNSLFDDRHFSVEPGTVRQTEIDIGEDTPVRCMENGIWAAESDGCKLVILLTQAERYGQITGVQVEVAVPPGPAGEAVTNRFFQALETGIAAAGSYRGKVLSLEISAESYTGRAEGLRVHRLRPVDRGELILPERTLGQIDRNLLRFAEQRRKLAAHGLSAKKGVLFYGPPGTGKTHTLHYLVPALKGHTVLLVTAEQQGLIGEYFTLARLLQPSMIVIEDADLIAKRRGGVDNACVESLLNKLLNEMDGLRPDAEIFFILTSNRPEALEPALASRPGRIDQAIEFPLPDEECRGRLLELYAGKIPLDKAMLERTVANTKGVSAAFIKELIRRAVQAALEHGREGVVEQADMEDALQDLLQSGAALTRSLLGAGSGDGGAPLSPGPGSGAP